MNVWNPLYFKKTVVSALVILSCGVALPLVAKNIQIRGSTVLSQAEIESVLGGYRKQERVEVEDIAAMINGINAIYRDKGYVNSGLILPDQTQPNDLTLIAIEGVLDDIHIVNEGRLLDAYVEKIIKSKLTEPLNIHDLQLAFNRLERERNITKIQGKLIPGEVRGHSQLNLELFESTATNIRFSVNNYRSPSAGSEQAQFFFSHHNVSGRGDEVSVNLNTTDGASSSSVRYRLPLLSLNSHISAFYAQGDTLVVEEPFDEIDIESNTDTVGINLETIFFEQASRTLNARLSLEKKKSQSFLLGLPFDFTQGSVNGESKASILGVSFIYQQRRTQQAFSASLSYRRGIDAFGATIQQGLADGQFELWQIQLNYVRLFVTEHRNLTFSIETKGQFTNDVLQAFERFALGGHDSIRGFRENQVLRDKAWQMRSQLLVPVNPSDTNGMALSIYPFVDVGKGSNARSQANVRQSIYLASIGIGLSMGYKKLLLNFEWAQRLNEKHRQTGKLQDRGIHLGLSYEF